MKYIRRILLFFALVLALAASASAAGVTSTTATIGGATARVIYVTPSETTVVAPVLANNSVGTDAAASSMISGAPGKVAAAINGNFFNSYYDASAPLDINTGNYARIFGAIVIDGRMICSGGSAALGFGYDGTVHIGRVELKGRMTISRTSYYAWGVNTLYSDSKAIYVLTEELDYAVDIPASSTVVTVRDGAVESVGTGCDGFVVPDGAVVLVINSGYNKRNIKVGASAVYDFTASGDDSVSWSEMRNVLGGSGLIVEHGVSAVDNNLSLTAEDQNPDVAGQRSFVAVLSDGRLMFGTVSSSYRKIAASLIEMGVTDAMMLDGGASSMLYADGSFPVAAGRKLASILAVMDASSDGGTTVAAAPSSWAVEDVDEARTLGILPASLDSSYQQGITRGEFCRLIGGYIHAKTGKTMEEYCKEKKLTVDTKKFSDIEDTDIACAAALEIVTGYPNGTFKPNAQILRQDAAIMLRRLAQVLGAEAEQEAKTFKDSDQIAEYARPGVDFVVSLGIMNGSTSGKFSPRSNITREQAVTTMMNIWRLLE